MISFKKRHKSHQLLSHEALFRRLKPKYRYNESLQANYQRYRAGHFGETSVDYKLSLFPKKDFFHLPSLRLKNHFKHFQMDSIILTPKLIFDLETKNLKGTLEYNATNKQLIQIDGVKKTSYNDPLLQAKIQKRHLQNWLSQFGIKIPIVTLVVSTNPSSIIRNEENDSLFNERFIPLEYLIFKLEEIYDSYQEYIISFHDLKKLYHLMIKYDKPLFSNLVNFYNLNSNHFIKGIACEKCDFFPLNRNRGYWICPKCGQTDYDAHERVILDYFLLYESEITSRICTNLLQTATQNTVYHLLTSMNLKRIGGKKNRKYLSPELSKFPQDAIPKIFTTSILDK
ncbi:nuclease-related domain-containing protein [Pseudogracilibacillus sp. SO30301A]|uniref:nuclease-related domain-containing protein n=1 Tax=Pseudogracilibacillus sp. SO30301A TaxID=3098291 RepID=UPI00300E1769